MGKWQDKRKIIIIFRPASIMPDSETVPVCTVFPCEMACQPPFGTDVTETFIGPGVRVVMRIDDVTRPLFFLYGNDTEFTIDYGDGVDSQDYTLSGKRALTTRDIPTGTELTLTVKNCDSVKFCDGSYTSNPLREISALRGSVPVCIRRPHCAEYIPAHLAGCRTLRLSERPL